MSDLMTRGGELSHERVYYVQDGPTQYGPHSEVEIAELVQSGQIAPTAMICQSGWPSWAVMPAGIAALAPQASAADALAASIPRTRTHRVQVERAAASSRARLAKPRSSFAAAFMATLGVCVALLVVGFFSGFFGGFVTAVHPVVTREAYDQVAPGMSYERVLQIVGHAPTESEASAIRGFGDIVPPIDSADYVWRNADGSGMGAVFVNNRMTLKVQKNLR